MHGRRTEHSHIVGCFAQRRIFFSFIDREQQNIGYVEKGRGNEESRTFRTKNDSIDQEIEKFVEVERNLRQWNLFNELALTKTHQTE